MEFSILKELHYITPIDNLESILKYGIVCHRDAERHKHISVADASVQEKRSQKRIPGGLPLHHYANLYINARNPMLYRLCRYNRSPEEICVLKISLEVLNLPDVIIADGNAARQATRFFPSPAGLAHLDERMVFTRYWSDPNPIIADTKKWRIMAEVLVPENIDIRFIQGVYVASNSVKQKLTATGIVFPIDVNDKLFFLEN